MKECSPIVSNDSIIKASLHRPFLLQFQCMRGFVTDHIVLRPTAKVIHRSRDQIKYRKSHIKLQPKSPVCELIFKETILHLNVRGFPPAFGNCLQLQLGYYITKQYEMCPRRVHKCIT